MSTSYLSAAWSVMINAAVTSERYCCRWTRRNHPYHPAASAGRTGLAVPMPEDISTQFTVESIGRHNGRYDTTWGGAHIPRLTGSVSLAAVQSQVVHVIFWIKHRRCSQIYMSVVQWLHNITCLSFSLSLCVLRYGKRTALFAIASVRPSVCHAGYFWGGAELRFCMIFIWSIIFLRKSLILISSDAKFTIVMQSALAYARNSNSRRLCWSNLQHLTRSWSLGRRAK